MEHQPAVRQPPQCGCETRQDGRDEADAEAAAALAEAAVAVRDCDRDGLLDGGHVGVARRSALNVGGARHCTAANEHNNTIQ